MLTVSQNHVWAFVSALVVSGAAVADATSTLRYELHDLGSLGGKNSAALDMNDSGMVVGWADLPATIGKDIRTTKRERRAFVWQKNVMTDIGSLGGNVSEARAVNGLGQVVGLSTDSSGDMRAFYWFDGVMYDLNDLIPVVNPAPGDTRPEPVAHSVGENIECNAPFRLLVEANDINEEGYVVGCGLVEGDDMLHGFILVPSGPYDAASPSYTLQDLGQLPGQGTAYAYGMNDVPQVVGTSGLEPFLWHRGQMIALNESIRTGDPTGRATAINELGEAVGWVGCTGWDRTACVWRDGQRHELTSSPDWMSIAWDINDQGLIVGMGILWDSLPVALLWDDEETVDLTQVTLLPMAHASTDSFQWSSLEEATAIDTTGNVVGIARSVDGRQRGFLLTPLDLGPEN